MLKVGCTYHGTLGVLLSFKKLASNVYTIVYSEYRVQRIHEIWGGGLILGLPRNPRIFSLHEFGYWKLGLSRNVQWTELLDI
jgi:hypothetical protein